MLYGNAEARFTVNPFRLMAGFFSYTFSPFYRNIPLDYSSPKQYAGVWLPDSSGWHEIMNFKTKADFDGTTFGFGVTPTVGVNGYFLALDANFSWTDIDA